MKTKMNIDAKLAIEGYHRKNTRNLMVYADGVGGLRRKKDFLLHLDSLNLLKTNERPGD
ncbi:MAG: hypothetical protein HXY46_10970 [Syntrophaceae bacterium]|nr:hypothetical protein [Syntrophaceae bacterium]